MLHPQHNHVWVQAAVRASVGPLLMLSERQAHLWRSWTSRRPQPAPLRRSCALRACVAWPSKLTSPSPRSASGTPSAQEPWHLDEKRNLGMSQAAIWLFLCFSFGPFQMIESCHFLLCSSPCEGFEPNNVHYPHVCQLQATGHAYLPLSCGSFCGR